MTQYDTIKSYMKDLIHSLQIICGTVSSMVPHMAAPPGALEDEGFCGLRAVGGSKRIVFVDFGASAGHCSCWDPAN